jgi:type II secretory ATPase GspE/PulE/Tfp pilus assembly ATPase PilB-like protein
MVGEVRDLETATIAIQSALTGHLVFSTLHTNDAPSSITRLLDLGVEPYLAASSVNALLAQRLVRTVCGSCKQSVPLDGDAMRKRGWTEDDVAFLKNLGVKETVVSSGCQACFNTGFLGRTAIFELLIVTEAIRDLIVKHAPSGEIKKAAVGAGMVTLRRDGLRRVANGTTTLDEVWSVTQMDIE